MPTKNNSIQNLNQTFPLVSIVIATYNRASSLEKYSLPSLYNLTYPNYEVIIVDDASTDETKNFLQTYQVKSENLFVLHNQQNSGAAFSRNRGAIQAKGEFVVLIDDDVSLFPDALEKLVEAYQTKPEIMVIWGCVWQHNNSMQSSIEAPRKTFGNGSFWSLRTKIFKSDRFDVNMKYFNTPQCDEHEFARRLKRYGYQFMQLETAQAKHFHSFADNRKRRGIGGDLNYLYENLKTGSILEYYWTLIKGFWSALVFLITRHKKTINFNRRYKQLFLTPEHIRSFIQEQKLDVAIKWLYYVIIDIPFKAKTQVIIESFNHHSTLP
jgi:glycosyltransferase involved in cell wall biosynthesis